MNIITLESLIQEHKERISQLKYEPSPRGSWGYDYYYYEDDEAYQKWLATTKRYIGIKFHNDKDVVEFETISREDLSPEQQNGLLAILEALSSLPKIILDKQSSGNNEKDRKGKTINVTTNITNSNSQSQNQRQEQILAVELFLEAIKDDLTGRQIKELKVIVADAGNDLQKARTGIIDKLKSFGSDVMSNIIANIITNPIIWIGM